MVFRLGVAALLGVFFLVAVGWCTGMSSQFHIIPPGLTSCSASVHFITFLLPVREQGTSWFIFAGVLLAFIFLLGTFSLLSGEATHHNRYPYFLKNHRTYSYPFDFLLEAFRRGILHPRIY